ncbi:MAG: hypothetical protein LUF85_12835 [Bacteroides sp.]|nr:hypothetical protein [Bacteroides sp.]
MGDNDSIQVQTICRSVAASVTINTPRPTLTTLQVVDKRGFKKEKFKYGDKVIIEVGATGLTEYNYIAIRVSNPDWKQIKEYSMHECMIAYNSSSPDGKKIQVFKLEFSAEPGWLKDQSKYKSSTTVEAFLCGSNYLPLNYQSWQQMRNDVDYDNPISELKVEDIEISKIIVFLDPGHGFMNIIPRVEGGYNTGGVIRPYKDKKGNIIKIHQLEPEHVPNLIL